MKLHRKYSFITGVVFGISPLFLMWKFSPLSTEKFLALFTASNLLFTASTPFIVIVAGVFLFFFCLGWFIGREIYYRVFRMQGNSDAAIKKQMGLRIAESKILHSLISVLIAELLISNLIGLNTLISTICETCSDITNTGPHHAHTAHGMSGIIYVLTDYMSPLDGLISIFVWMLVVSYLNATAKTGKPS